MGQSIATPETLPGVIGDVGPVVRTTRATASSITARATPLLGEVEALWCDLARQGIESPGQSLAFIKRWIAAMGIPEADQLYVVGEIDGMPVALLPLHRRKRGGVRVVSWFPGAHVGCNAPLVDRARLAALPKAERRQLWARMIGAVSGADVLHLKAVPELVIDGVDLFAELGQSLSADMLYRAQFSSWDEANTTQRTKSRRKHDRQQGDKLDAMGEVSFEERRGTPDTLDILDLMFRQRAARFVEMGVSDPFCINAIRRFYDSTVAEGSEVDVRLHILRLDGEIVALRYNIVDGDRMFCLISSMSTEACLQPGSPGKQCLLRVMQTVFDNGMRVFDMGAGHTDEKRHWCNVQIPVRGHYAALSLRGHVAVLMHRSWQQLRKQIKANKQLLGVIKSLRSRLQKATAEKAEPAEG